MIRLASPDIGLKLDERQEIPHTIPKCRPPRLDDILISMENRHETS
jgi:hypothetical protein